LTQLIVPEEFTAYIPTLPEFTYISLESGEKIQSIVKIVVFWPVMLCISGVDTDISGEHAASFSRDEACTFRNT
jgi:hypothetical protein